jgi:uncharacterized membrane protein YeaQ/YmgE (transglycosylase-associated protein family)
MGILSWLVLGLVAGALAKWIMPGKDPGGIIVTMLIGIAGSLIGGFLGSFVGLGATGTLSIGSVATAVVGALILLFIYRKVKGGKAASA